MANDEALQSLVVGARVEADRFAGVLALDGRERLLEAQHVAAILFACFRIVQGVVYPGAIIVMAVVWACGSMARVASPEMNSLMRAWWHEIVTWSVQDQISLPFVCRQAAVQPVAFPWDQYQNPYVRIHRHSDGT